MPISGFFNFGYWLLVENFDQFQSEFSSKWNEELQLMKGYMGGLDTFSTIKTKIKQKQQTLGVFIIMEHFQNN